jgi:hypothetical protein
MWDWVGNLEAAFNYNLIYNWDRYCIARIPAGATDPLWLYLLRRSNGLPPAANFPKSIGAEPPVPW